MKLQEPEGMILTVAADQSSSEARRIISDQAADETLRLIEEHGDDVGELTTQNERRLKRKIYLHVLLLVVIIDLMLYVGGTPCLLFSARTNQLVPRLIDLLFADRQSDPLLLNVAWDLRRDGN